jgi:hypothetical protein
MDPQLLKKEIIARAGAVRDPLHVALMHTRDRGPPGRNVRAFLTLFWRFFDAKTLKMAQWDWKMSENERKWGIKC